MAKNKRSRYTDQAVEEKLADGVESLNTEEAAIDQLSGKDTEATGFVLSNAGLKELFYKTTTSENMAAHDAIQFETGISDGETRVVANLNYLPSIPKTGNAGEVKVIGIDEGEGFNSGIFFDSVSFIRDDDTRSDIEANGSSTPTRSYSQPSLSEIALTPSGASGDVRVVAIVEVVGL